MKSIDASVDIAATPAEVWRVLTDFPAYPDWNPFLTAIDGHATQDTPVTVHIALGSGATLPLSATVIEVQPDEKLVWRSHTIAAGLFDRDHIIRIEPNATGCIVTQSQTFDGPIASIAASLADGLVRHGLGRMNDALKRRVEATGAA